MCIRWLLPTQSVTIQTSPIWEFATIFQDEWVSNINFCFIFKGCKWSSCRSGSCMNPSVKSVTGTCFAHTRGRGSWWWLRTLVPLHTSGDQVRAGRRHVRTMSGTMRRVLQNEMDGFEYLIVTLFAFGGATVDWACWVFFSCVPFGFASSKRVCFERSHCSQT